MSVRRRMPAAAIAALLALPLAACTPAQPAPTPSPTSAHTRLFASDAEALKAATDAYAAYLKVTDNVLSEGGADSARLESVASGDALKKVRADTADFKDNNAHTVGTTKFDSVRLAFFEPGARQPVAIYVCDDVSNVDVVDSSGKSLVAPDRKARTPWHVTFVRPANEGHLLVAERALWTGGGFCAG
ncbi:hypothetical protein GCM10028798_20500 [Humibacter antri]